jgi:dUTP pyrophosphatase
MSCKFLKIKKLTENAYIPVRSSQYAAGLDLFSPIDALIKPGERQLIKLDISMKLDNYTYGHILPRSGLALKNGIHVGAGIIDSDYRGNVGVLLFNLSDSPFVVSKGDRIAQMVIKKYEYLVAVEVDELDETLRGSGGFGSTGV